MASEAQGTAEEVRIQCPAALLPTFDALCVLIRKQAGKHQEVAWPRQKILSFGVGPKKMSQHHCYVAVYAEHLNLGFYQGAALPDPSKVLQGTGKGLRHIKVKSASEANQSAVINLVCAAVAEREPYRAKA